MYDLRTGSRWTQVGGEAIEGPLHGETLELLPSRIARWGDWREAHPDTRVVNETGQAQPAAEGRPPSTVPAPGVLGVVAAVGAGALALRRRR